MWSPLQNPDPRSASDIADSFRSFFQICHYANHKCLLEILSVYRSGNLEHDDIPTIDNSIASMSPRTFDDIPVSTVFAEEKSRESENSDTRKSTTSLRSQNSRKISRESRDSKKSKKSEKSEKSNQSENEPDSESVETAKKLKKQLEDTIRKYFRKIIKY